ncbi:unnamed protein product [Litomosoides sigmodontis]|uniref:SXP/RAL-2 family protein Ani s 5-like cation-binding domain-containing protein n=1 Tax=Litomosoides sigmodontis TaxID=42156 RepID=A0A3P6SQQ9_LITSI|nr:unnamed protein product [Litomosoides sigmodontis]
MKYFILLSIGLVAGIAIAQQGGDTNLNFPESILPPFLINAPYSIVQQYLDIVKDADSKTNQQVADELDKLMRRLGEPYLSEHERLKQMEEQEQAKFEKIHDAAVAKFSPEAKEADAKMIAIVSDPSLTNHVKRERIQAIMESLSAPVRKEIEDALNPSS